MVCSIGWDSQSSDPDTCEFPTCYRGSAQGDCDEPVMQCTGIAWERPRGSYELPPNEVHVWKATLDQPQGCYSVLLQTLSPDERARADRFHFEADRKRHILARGITRSLLGRVLDRPADMLQFEYNEFGKPALARSHDNPIEFNASHSGDLVLVALSHSRILGVDVERMKSDMATAEIASRFFSPSECRALAALPPDLKCPAFFCCWTRKEAYLKARGDGLSLPLDQFDVAFVPGAEPRLLETRHDPAEVSRWTLRALDVGPGHKAALVAAGSDWTLRCLEWSWMK
jgi:4'-phosphopantetheinyl transferase